LPIVSSTQESFNCCLPPRWGTDGSCPGAART